MGCPHVPIALDHPLAEPLFLSLFQFHWILIPQIVPPPLQLRKIEIRGTKHMLLDVVKDVEDALQPTTAATLARNTLRLRVLCALLALTQQRVSEATWVTEQENQFSVSLLRRRNRKPSESESQAPSSES